MQADAFSSYVRTQCRGRHLRTLDGNFAEELRWMTDEPSGSPTTIANSVHPPPKYKAVRECQRSPGLWPGRAGTLPLGPWPLDENEDLPMKRNLPFKKMKRDGRSIVSDDVAHETAWAHRVQRRSKITQVYLKKRVP
ncbi:hypothetical protein MRX96_051189 [Rhipicephalus microplus]